MMNLNGNFSVREDVVEVIIFECDLFVSHTMTKIGLIDVLRTDSFHFLYFQLARSDLFELVF